MDKQKLILPVSILLGCIILGSFYYASEINKQNSTEKQQISELQTKIEQQDLPQNKIKEVAINQENLNSENTNNLKQQKIKNSVSAFVAPTTKEAAIPAKTAINENQQISLLSVQALPTAHEATFTITTNVPSSGYVTIWPILSNSGTAKIEFSELKTIHSITTNLSLFSNKKYFYSATVTGENGTITTSEEKNFTTPTDIIPPRIMFTPTYMNNGIVNFNLKSDEHTTARVTWRTGDDITKYYTYELEEGTNYTIELAVGDKGYVPNWTKIFITIDAFDNDYNHSTNNYSFTLGTDIKYK